MREERNGRNTNKRHKKKNITENDGNRDYRDSDNANIKCISETILDNLIYKVLFIGW
jgi:hypothetical protein